jgi:membrane protein DedA with SNARE-associated domain
VAAAGGFARLSLSRLSGTGARLDLSHFARSLTELIGASVETDPRLSYLAIALAMLLENVFPPLPSELVMPLAGFLVHEGKLDLLPVIFAGLVGTVLGAWFWYGIGRLVNEQRLERFVARRGRWLGIRPELLATSRSWFARHGPAVVFWGRCLPGIRPFVSVPAGIELMPQASFLLWTSAGSLIWLLALTLAGQALGAGYRHVLAWIEPLAHLLAALSLLALAAGLAWVVIRAVRRARLP